MSSKAVVMNGIKTHKLVHGITFNWMKYIFTCIECFNDKEINTVQDNLVVKED